MKTLVEYRLFLGCSKDLKAYRDQFEILIRRKNNDLLPKGVYLNLFMWEDSLEIVSPEGSQSEYNKYIEQANIFILLFQDKVGKYTREEFEKAYTRFQSNNKPFIFVYNCGKAAVTSTESSLADFLQRLNDIRHFPSNCSDPDNLLLKFSDQLDKLFTVGHLKYGIENPNDQQINEKIYFCNRQEQSRLFDKNIQDRDAIQFALITCHERDIAEYFIKRKELEWDEEERESTIHLQIRLANVEQETYEDLEELMKMAIRDAWKKHELLKNFAFRKSEEYTIENMLQVLSSLKQQYLIITWKVRSFYWKGSRLQDYISAFYNKYYELNKSLNTAKKIFFIGILSYTEDPQISWEQFLDRVKNLQFGKIPIRLTKITIQQVKDWMEECDIENNPDDQNILIEKVLPDYRVQQSYYMSELENPLNTLLKLV